MKISISKRKILLLFILLTALILLFALSYIFLYKTEREQLEYFRTNDDKVVSGRTYQNDYYYLFENIHENSKQADFLLNSLNDKWRIDTIIYNPSDTTRMLALVNVIYKESPYDYIFWVYGIKKNNFPAFYFYGGYLVNVAIEKRDGKDIIFYGRRSLMQFEYYYYHTTISDEDFWEHLKSDEFDMINQKIKKDLK